MLGDTSQLLVVFELVPGDLVELLIEPLLFILKLDIGHLCFFVSLKLLLHKQVQELRVVGESAVELCLRLKGSRMLAMGH